MRPIDADALMDVIRQHEYRLATKQGSIDYGMFTLGIQQAVDEQPTIDAVEVVRCRECDHKTNDGNDRPYCLKLEMYLNKELDFFCKYGERKEGTE